MSLTRHVLWDLRQHGLTGVCCPVVFLQNDLRVREGLGAVAFEVVESVVSFNVVRDRVASTVTMSQTMDTAVLVLDGKCPASKSIAASLVRTPITTKVDEDFRAVQCGKLLINMTNAVNALSGVGIGPMLMETDYRLPDQGPGCAVAGGEHTPEFEGQS